MVKTKIYFLWISLLFFEKVYSNHRNLHSDSAFVKSKILNFRDIKGKVYSIKKRDCVFIFIDVECPVSQFYTQTIQKLFLKYSKTGILFFAVFPTKYTQIEDIELFKSKYQFEIPCVLDKFQNITQKLNATTTPEVFVLNKDSKIVYSGSIDDSYFALGKRNLNPKHCFLNDAIVAIIKNQKPLISQSNAIGCEIQRNR